MTQVPFRQCLELGSKLTTDCSASLTCDIESGTPVTGDAQGPCNGLARLHSLGCLLYSSLHSCVHSATLHAVLWP